MCGIGGIISRNEMNFEQRKLFEDLMKSLQSRGRDAFGYVSYPSQTITKSPTDVDDYLKDRKQGIKTKIKGSIFALGHTRAKTKGTHLENYNNHPFKTKDFILAHNGTIRNDDDIRKYFKINSKIETDSYSIVALIQHFYDQIGDIVKSIAEARYRLKGSFACWLLHKSTGDIYLFKASSSDLSLAYIKEWDSILFASTINNFEDEIKEYFPESNEEHGLFNTNILVKKLDGDKIYKINIKNKKKDWIEKYEYEDKTIDLEDEFGDTDIDIVDINEKQVSNDYVNNEKDDFDKEAEEEEDELVYCSKTKIIGRNKHKKVFDKHNNPSIMKKIRILKELGFEFECSTSRVKVYVPPYASVRNVFLKNGFSLGGNNKNRLNLKDKNSGNALFNNLVKMEKLANKYCIKDLVEGR